MEGDAKTPAHQPVWGATPHYWYEKRSACVCVGVRRKDSLPCCVVGVDPTVGGSSDWTSFLILPVSTRSYRQGTGNGMRVCVCLWLRQGNRLRCCFLISKSLLTSHVCLFTHQIKMCPPPPLLPSCSQHPGSTWKWRQDFFFVAQTSALLLGYISFSPTMVPWMPQHKRVCVFVCLIVRQSYLCQRLQCCPPPHTHIPSLFSISMHPPSTICISFSFPLSATSESGRREESYGKHQNRERLFYVERRALLRTRQDKRAAKLKGSRCTYSPH